MKTLVLALAVAATPAAAQSLLVNGSFEGQTNGYTLLGGGSTAINGWTTTGEGVEWFDTSSFGPAYDGNNLIDLAWFTSTGTPGGGIEQAIATQAGSAYTVTFYGTTHRTNGRNGTGIINLLIDGGALGSYSVNNQNATFTLGDWQRFDATFTATGAQTVIRFTNTQNAFQHFAYLDGVTSQLAAVPEPASWAMMLLGFGAIGASLRRAPRRAAMVA